MNFRPPFWCGSGVGGDLDRFCGFAFWAGGGAEDQLVIFGTYLGGIARLEVAAKDLFCHRIFEVTFHRSAHGASAVLRIVAFFDKEFLGLIVEDDGDMFAFDTGGDFFDFQVDDGEEFGFAEGVEDDEIIETVDEFGFEDPFGLAEDFVFHDIISLIVFVGGGEAHHAGFFDEFRADVGSHDDDGVAEVDFPGERIGNFSFFENLQEEVHDIGVGLFDFVEKNHAVGATPNRFTELAAFFVADVAGRRTDQTASGKFLHVLGHIDLDEGIAIAEHELCKGLSEKGFADACWAEEDERADGASGIFEIGTGTAQGLANGDDRFVLPDHLATQLAFHGEEFLGLGLFHAVEGDAGPFGDDVHDIVIGDDDFLFFALLAPFGEDGFEFFFGVFFVVAEAGGFFEVLRFDGGFFGGADVFDFFFDVFDVGGASHGTDAGAGPGFVHDVDGFIGQEATGEVTIAEFDGLFEGGVGVASFVMGFVFYAEAFEDEDRFIDAGGFDFDLLEAAFEGGIFFDVLAELIESRGPDALHFATAEGGFENIAGIHGALGASCANDRVEFVDEKNDIFCAADFIHDGLDALFELASVLGSCDHEGEVEGDDLFVAEEFGDISTGDFLGEAFDDGGLPDAGFADEDGVIFCAAAEDLDDAFDFVGATDDGIDFALLGEFGEISTKGTERGGFEIFSTATCGFGLGFLFAVSWGEIGVEFLEDFVTGAFDIDLEIFEDASGNAFALAEEAEENVLGADIRMVEGFGFFAGEGEDFFHAGGVGNIADHFGFGATSDLFFDLHANGLEVEAHFLEDIHGHALAEFDETKEEMFGADVVVIKAIGLFSSEGENLLGAGCEVVHHLEWSFFRTAATGHFASAVDWSEI